jgi:hypothetical protein
MSVNNYITVRDTTSITSSQQSTPKKSSKKQKIAAIAHEALEPVPTKGKKLPVQSTEKLVRQEFAKMCNPKNPLHKFLPPDFQDKMNALIHNEEWEEAQTSLIDDRASASKLREQEKKFETRILKAVYQDLSAPLFQARTAKNFRAVLNRLKSQYRNSVQNFPIGFSKQIQDLEEAQEYEKALRLFELAVALVTHEDIRAYYEETGIEMVRQYLSVSGRQTPASTWETLQNVFHQTIMDPIQSLFGKGATESDLSEKGQTLQNQIRVAQQSAGELEWLETFLLYSVQNESLRKRLSNQPERDPAEELLFGFTHGAHSVFSQNIETTKNKIVKILQNRNIQEIRTSMAGIDKIISKKMDIENAQHTFTKLARKKEHHAQFILDLLKEFQFIYPYHKEALLHWKHQVRAKYTAFCAASGTLTSKVSASMAKLFASCDEICRKNEAIQKSFQNFHPQASDQLVPTDIYSLNNMLRIANIVPAIDLPAITKFQQAVEEIGTHLESLDALFRAASTWEAGDISLHVEEKLREYQGKSKNPSAGELLDPETFYFSMIGKMRHAALINVQHNSTQTVEITDAGYSNVPARFEDALYTIDYTPDFSKIIRPEQKENVKRLLGQSDDRALFAALKHLYQTKMNALVLRHEKAFSAITYTESAENIVLCAIANTLDEATNGKLLTRTSTPPTPQEQMENLPQTMKCSEFVGFLFKLTLSSLEKDFNDMAGTENVPYFKEVLPPLTEGITPAQLKTFADKFCTEKGQNYFAERCVRSAE